MIIAYTILNLTRPIRDILLLKGMIMMASTYCHKECCDVKAKQPNEDSRMSNSDKLLAVGIYILSVAVTSVTVWYANAHGITIDPAYLP